MKGTVVKTVITTLCYSIYIWNMKWSPQTAQSHDATVTLYVSVRGTLFRSDTLRLFSCEHNKVFDDIVLGESNKFTV